MKPTFKVLKGARFRDGIAHPELYLWDSWTYEQRGELHLYCLAVSRTREGGAPLAASERNDVPFHVRHFVSTDDGLTWLDLGVFQEPRPGAQSFDAKTIWSGSVTVLADGRKLVAFTGLADHPCPRVFMQSMGTAISLDGHHIEPDSIGLISCPFQEWSTITQKGYFLGEREQLGHQDGEDGGPIMAWRDPYVLVQKNTLHMFWCAKSARSTPVIGHAILREDASGFAIDSLEPPITVPDAALFTQLELPKVLYDPVREKFYLIVATCNRQYEGQSDAEVDKQIRLYEADALAGPWRFHFKDGSSLGLEDQYMFGMSILNADFAAGTLRCIAPYTEASESPLCISPTFDIQLAI